MLASVPAAERQRSLSAKSRKRDVDAPPDLIEADTYRAHFSDAGLRRVA